MPRCHCRHKSSSRTASGKVHISPTRQTACRNPDSAPADFTPEAPALHVRPDGTGLEQLMTLSRNSSGRGKVDSRMILQSAKTYHSLEAASTYIREATQRLEGETGNWPQPHCTRQLANWENYRTNPLRRYPRPNLRTFLYRKIKLFLTTKDTKARKFSIGLLLRRMNCSGNPWCQDKVTGL